MQESFTRYFSRYKTQGGNRAILYTIARNTAIDAFRKRREELLEHEVPSFDNPEKALLEKQAVDRMTAAIGQLYLEDQKIIALLMNKPVSYKEIGQRLNISQLNVKVKVHRARIRLKQILKNGEK